MRQTRITITYGDIPPSPTVGWVVYDDDELAGMGGFTPGPFDDPAEMIEQAQREAARTPQQQRIPL